MPNIESFPAANIDKSDEMVSIFDVRKRFDELKDELAIKFPGLSPEDLSEINKLYFEKFVPGFNSSILREISLMEDNEAIKGYLLELHEAMREMTKSYKEARYDEITGLERRGELYRGIEVELKELLGLDKDEKLEKEDWYKALSEFSVDGMKDDDRRYVLMSDVSFLSLANDAGHKVGDDLLKQISYILKTEQTGLFRHGGDEITGIKKSEADNTIQEQIFSTKMKISSLSGVANLDHYNLQPNVDFGEAEIREALTIFQNLLHQEDENERNINQRRVLAGDPCVPCRIFGLKSQISVVRLTKEQRDYYCFLKKKSMSQECAPS